MRFKTQSEERGENPIKYFMSLEAINLFFPVDVSRNKIKNQKQFLTEVENYY